MASQLASTAKGSGQSPETASRVEPVQSPRPKTNKPNVGQAAVGSGSAGSGMRSIRSATVPEASSGPGIRTHRSRPWRWGQPTDTDRDNPDQPGEDRPGQAADQPVAGVQGSGERKEAGNRAGVDHPRSHRDPAQPPGQAGRREAGGGSANEEGHAGSGRGRGQ